MRYSLIRQMDISNGAGIGISLFVQGCHFHCVGCFNQDTWDFSGGKLWTADIKKQFIELADKPHIKRISILGGEPLSDENVEEVYSLIRELKQKYPYKQIWLYTGYSFDDINKEMSIRKFSYLDSSVRFNVLRRLAVQDCSVIVDGRFQLQNQDINKKTAKWRGSTNQRVIDIPNTLKTQSITLYEENEFENSI